MMPARYVLVVDDDPAQREGIAEVLKGRGYCVATAANGWEALELATSTSPSLILLDLNMPIMTGWELLRALRWSAALRDIPVIVASGQDEVPPDVDVLQKPYPLEKLLERIEGVLFAAAPGARRA